MNIIKRKRGNVIYVCEQKYIGKKDGKNQYKEKVLGHLDEAGKFIPSKKMRGKKPEDFPAEIQKVTTTTTKIRVVEKKPIEPEIVKDDDPVKNEKNEYTLMKQGTATNKLTKLKTEKSNVKFDPLTRNGTMTWNDFTVTMKNFSEIAGFRSSTHKLLDALLIEFTETGGKDTKITMPLKKYMELRNLKDEKTARQQLDEDLETLYNASISFSQNSKNSRKRRDYIDMRLVIDKGIKRGIIQCTFHPDFYNLMNSYQVMPMAKKALALNDKHNPNAYYFLKELCEHTNMNYGKPNQNLISVATLLKSTPEIPSYGEVEKSDRHYDTRIIEPFERDMEALETVEAVKWEYCHSNALPLNDEELSKMDYETFSKLLIHFELTGYPQRTLPEKPKNKVKKNTDNKA